MATSLPKSHFPRQPHQDLPPSSPPDRGTFHMNHLLHDIPSNALRPQRHNQVEFRANGTPSFPAGDGPLPMPSGPHPHVANGGPRHRASVSGPAFDGPRSPPNAKSMHIRMSQMTTVLTLVLPRYLPRTLQIFQIWTMSSWPSLSLLPLH